GSNAAHCRRSRETKRSGRVRAALLRAPAADRQPAHRRQPAALPQGRAAPPRGHPGGATGRHSAEGNRRGAADAAGRAHAHATRLDAAVGALACLARCEDHRPHATARPARYLHRMRLPLDPPMPAVQPRRHARRRGPGTEIADRGARPGPL
ncbi:MAG: Redox-sensitive transcriptional activator SoxR, partial [uncultured Lysobacter sp.]